MKRDYLFAGLLFILAFIQYSNTLDHGYVWDDKIVIEENPYVQQGVSGISDIFSRHSSDFRHDQYGYRPITLLSFALDIDLFGLNPSGGHWMSTVYYAILCVVIYFFLRQLFREHQRIIPFLITAIFVVHPLHVEVVANIKSRDEILSLLFGILSFMSFIKFYKDRKIIGLIFFPILFVLALLSKESAIVFIPLYLLIAFYLDPKFNKRKLFSMAPLLLLGIISYLTVTGTLDKSVSETEGFGAIHEYGELGNSFFPIGHDKLAILPNSLHLLLIYFKNFFLPFNLAYFSGYNYLPIIGWSSPLAWGSLLLFGGLFYFSIRYFRKYPAIAFGLLFFFISISFYLQIARVLLDTMADRFMFTASLGLSISVVFGLYKLFQKGKESAAVVKPVIGIVSGLGLIFLVTSFSRNQVWESDKTLITSDMEKLENSARAHYYFASLLNQEIISGKTSTKKINEMISHYERSIEISDDSYYSFLELGTYYLTSNQFTAANQVFSKALLKFPNSADLHFYSGRAYHAMNKTQEAIKFYEKSIELAPKQSDSYFYLSLTLTDQKKFDEGIEVANKMQALFPENEIQFNELISQIKFEQGELKNSTEILLKNVQLGMNEELIYKTIIGRYQVVGDEENALRYYQIGLSKGFFKQ